MVGGRQLLHGRAKSENISVEVDECSLVLAPFGVFGRMELGSNGPPCLGERIGIVNPQIGRVLRTCRADVQHDSEMNLDAVTSHESVPTTFVLPNVETESFIVRQ